jgi:hypothetical protein
VVADAAPIAIVDAPRMTPRVDAGFVRAPVDAAAVAAIDAAIGTGYLLVIGEELIGASVIVDGVPAGSVPNPIAVALGSRRVEIEKRDGTRLPARTVEIKAIHSRVNPARLSW